MNVKQFFIHETDLKLISILKYLFDLPAFIICQSELNHLNSLILLEALVLQPVAEVHRRWCFHSICTWVQRSSKSTNLSIGRRLRELRQILLRLGVQFRRNLSTALNDSTQGNRIRMNATWMAIYHRWKKALESYRRVGSHVPTVWTTSTSTPISTLAPMPTTRSPTTWTKCSWWHRRTRGSQCSPTMSILTRMRRRGIFHRNRMTTTLAMRL